MAPRNQRHKGLRLSKYRGRVDENPKRQWYASELAKEGRISFLKC